MADITGIWHFTDNEYAQVAIETLIETFGEEFVAPLAAQFQPIDASIFNSASLLQFDLPTGALLAPLAELSQAESIASAINSLMNMLSPLMSAYGMITTIIEVIVAIIEVLCALINPLAVKRAVKKLLKIAIPKLIKLFPYIAAVVLIINIIKMILAIVIFILTVVIPMLILLYENAKTINLAILSMASGDFNSDAVDAGKEKIQALITELMNQIGLLKAFLPLFELIMAILKLNIRFPCKKDCCDEDVCPDLLKNPPAGRALMVPTTFGGSEPYFAFRILTNDARVRELQKYNQSSEQLNQQLDEAVSVCCPAGSGLEDCPNFSVRIVSRRGGPMLEAAVPSREAAVAEREVAIAERATAVTEREKALDHQDTRGIAAADKKIAAADKRIAAADAKIAAADAKIAEAHIISARTILAPVVKFEGPAVTVIDPDLKSLIGYVNFEIVPNFDVLFARGVIGLGCHPEIIAVREEAMALFPGLETPPSADAGDTMDETIKVVETLDKGISDFGDLATDAERSLAEVEAAVAERETAVANGDSEGIAKADAKILRNKDPYDLDKITEIQNRMILLLNNFIDFLKRKLRSLADTSTNINNSTIDVSKSVVRADMVDLSIVSVTPRDDANHAILKNMPEDVIPSIEIYSTLGALSNKRFDKTTGSIFMDLKSPLTGTAQITAKVNSDFIADKINGTNVIRKVNVRFVADSALPSRRKVPATIDKEPKRG